MPSLNALRSFEAAARHSSFRNAADELCVSVSAISHQIKQLEHYLDLDLFIRKTRSVELTKAGKLYYPILRDAFDKIAEGTQMILKPQRADVLTLQLYSSFAIRWLIPRLPTFHKKHPEINVRLNTAQTDVDFEHTDVDACVMIGNRKPNGLNYTYLFTSELFPVCSPSLLKGDTPLDSPSDISKHTIFQVYPSEHDWYYWLEKTGITNVNPESGLQFDNYDHSITTAIQGMGIALGMQPYVVRELDSGILVEPFPDLRIKNHGNWYYVYRQEKAELSKVTTFESWLQEEISKDSDLTHLIMKE